MDKKTIHIIVYSLFGIFIIANIIFFSSDFCFACQTDLTKDSNEVNIETISLNEWKSKISENVVIIDVRSPEEFNSGIIDGAINIDYNGINFKSQVSLLDKDKTYLIYCRSGHRGGLALTTFKELGFKEVYNLDGGINVWR